MANFRKLRVWQLGMDIVADVHGITDGFPRNGTGELKAQMRRCAISIASNIAEGANRGSDAEFKRFLAIALGSCGELDAQLEMAQVIQLVTGQAYEVLAGKVDREGKMLRQLMKRMS
jgi:four helix bundle protein